MTLLDRFKQHQQLLCLICDWAVVILLIVSIVWRGGKSLDMTWLLTGVAALSVWTMALHSKENQEAVVPLALWLAALSFIGVTLLSFLASTTKNYGTDELLRTTSLGLLFLWTINKVRHTPQQNPYALRLLRVFGFTAVGACFIGVLVYCFQPVSRFVGTFFDYRFHTDYWPNAWAQFLLLAWPIVLFLALKDFRYNPKEARSRLHLLVRSLTVGFVIGCLFLSYSRGAILVFILQLLLWGAVVYHKTRQEFPMRRIIPIGFVVTVIALSTFVAVNGVRSQVFEVQDVGAKVTFSASEGTSSVSERLQFWQQAATLALQKPLLGFGPYSFRFTQPALQEHVLATSDHPHNVVLKLLVERGVLAAALFLFIIGFVLVKAGVSLLAKERETDSLCFSLNILLFVGLSGVLLHNMIDYNLQFVGIALPFWLLLGVLVTYLDRGELRKAPVGLSRNIELLVAIMVFLFAFYEGSYLVVSSLGRHAEAANNREQALLWYGRAEGEVFKRDLNLSRAKILYEELRLEETLAAVDAYQQQNMQDYRAWARKGDIALLSKDPTQALAFYELAYEKGKYNDLGILRGILEAKLALDAVDEIETMLPEIDNLLTEYSLAIQNNTHFIALSPNVEEFVAINNMLSRLFSDQAPRYQVMAAKADHHAQVERGRIAARSPGFLW